MELKIWDINAYKYTILLMTSLFFYIGGNIFRSFLTVIFLYFYFCKKKKKIAMHVDFFT